MHKAKAQACRLQLMLRQSDAAALSTVTSALAAPVLAAKLADYVLTRKLLALLFIMAFLSSSMVTCRASRAGLIWHQHADSAAISCRPPDAPLA